jgi:hypothetical protein
LAEARKLLRTELEYMPCERLKKLFALGVDVTGIRISVPEKLSDRLSVPSYKIEIPLS